MARSITLIPARIESESAENEQLRRKRVAAYCRVSTDEDQQLNSFQAQRQYFLNLINSNPEYELVEIYADEGISGTNTKKREQFNKMIDDCKAGKIDIILSKSISRFARNTLDCLNYIRLLKELGIAIIFEKENINTLDSNGELLITLMSSLAQEESLSISKASTWGIRRRFEQGKVALNHTRFLGYDKDEQGNLIINENQAKIVRHIYKEILNGKGTNHIARELEQDKVKNWEGKIKWYESTIRSMLQNEKYKGDALLQKTYTVDFLSKTRVVNNGEVPKYYVEESHPAIIEPGTWEAVQLEMERRKRFCDEHGIKKLDTRVPFSSKVICSNCGAYYRRRTWMSPDGKNKRKVWMCSNRYKEKGIKGCESRHVYEDVLQKAFVEGFNTLLDNKQYLLDKWEAELDGVDELKRYRLKEFMEILGQEEKQTQFSEELCLKMLGHIEIIDAKGQFVITLLDGSNISCEI